MNIYQKSATLALRLFGFALLVIVALEILELVGEFFAGDKPAPQLLIVIAVYVLVGSMVITIAGGIGKWLGSDLG